MSHLISWLLVISIMISIIIATDTFRVRRKRKQYRKQIAEDNLRFNQCVDAINDQDVELAIKLYNQLISRNGNRAFLNGVMIGMQLPKTKAKLHRHKYQCCDPEATLNQLFKVGTSNTQDNEDSK